MKKVALLGAAGAVGKSVAGALGRPTAVMLKQVPDWRWLLDRGDSPWYPTVRLFRQGSFGDWTGAFAALKAHVAARRT